MTSTTLAAAYLLGGLTFLPLVLATVLTLAWLLLPQRTKAGDTHDDALISQKERDETEAFLRTQDEKYSDVADAAASGTFAVLRTYHFTAALAALGAKTGSGTSGVSGGNASTDGTVDTGSESVYQSMYRSVFDRSKNTSAANSVLENAREGSDASVSAKAAKKKAVGASVFYMVLRHGHLMLYDSAAQLEVRHVISLAHHTITLSEGGSLDDDEVIKDADLFIKRTAIVLTPMQQPNGPQQSQTLYPRPFFLFCSSCSDKEDFYHALLSTRTPPPIPQPLLPSDIIKLQSALHSSSLSPEIRALNALISRIFLGLHRTAFLERLIRTKIEQKIARVQKPAFIASLAVKSVDLGDAAPILSSPRLKDINISGDLLLAADVKYSGGLRLVIAAVAKIDLGSRFKTRTVDLVLSTCLQRLSGHILVRVKPPPSNRIWFCFESMPDMDIKVEPVVSTRQITYTFILRAIEDRIRSVVGETLVKPNWDDVPFFDTQNQSVRGGIWVEGRGSESSRVEAGAGETIVQTPSTISLESSAVMGENAMVMPGDHSPIIANQGHNSSASPGWHNASAETTSFHSPEAAAPLKRRSAASLPRPGDAGTTNVSRPLRSPSFTSPSPSAPSVAVDDTAGLPVRTDDEGLRPKKWRMRASLQNPIARREAVDAVREMQDRVSSANSRRATLDSSLDSFKESTDASATNELDDLPAVMEGDAASDADVSSHTGSPHRMDSDPSSVASSRSAQQRRQEQRKTVLSATAAATTAARNWSWNAINNVRARQTERQAQSAGSTGTPPRQQPAQPVEVSGIPIAEAYQQPMGRGQPLPPPGVPLPGPEKPKTTLWNAAAGSLGSLTGGSTVKRKPVLPPRRPLSSRQEPTEASDEGLTQPAAGLPLDPSGVSTGSASSPLVVDEFGPWRENSGTDTPVVVGPDVVFDEEAAPVTPGRGVKSDVYQARVSEQTFPGSRSPKEVEATRPANRVPPPLPARRPRRASRTSAAPVPADEIHVVQTADTIDDLLVDSTDSTTPATDRGYLAPTASATDLTQSPFDDSAASETASETVTASDATLLDARSSDEALESQTEHGQIAPYDTKPGLDSLAHDDESEGEEGSPSQSESSKDDDASPGLEERSNAGPNGGGTH
ncbi:hypothetical protein B0A50_06498 [Salinomyces thailandicus]|uniref:SMP-LTD domain-containing protein n=1 Tax=Salinomyces thailandicus TaxID=706561 RepID=A0A4U0TPE8_9PEZI|nr:hypothetical protein B0A50_06498 [Salinomyces thailandica]